MLAYPHMILQLPKNCSHNLPFLEMTKNGWPKAGANYYIPNCAPFRQRILPFGRAMRLAIDRASGSGSS